MTLRLTIVLLAGCGSQAATGLFFVDQTDTVGLNFAHSAPVGVLPYGTGAAWLDCDRDGDEDLWVTRRGGPSALYRNGGGGFTDVADAAGVADSTRDKAGIAVADLDGDGNVDVWVGRTGADAVYLGDGNCGFEEVAGSGLFDGGATQSGALGDMDGDGIVDLVTTDHTAVELPAPLDETGRATRVYRGLGDGRFELTGAVSGPSTTGAGFAVGLVDLDGDSDLDLVLVHDAFPGLPGNRAFRNNSESGAITLDDASTALGLDAQMSGMGLGIGDLDNDGQPDLAVSNIGRMALLHQGDDGTYTDRAAELGAGKDRHLDDAFTTWGLAFADFDNDGWQDLISAGGGLTGFSRYEAQPNGLWQNLGGTFADVIDGSGAELADESGRTLAIGDANGDGTPDVWVLHYQGSGRLLLADPSEGGWLQVSLTGAAPNTSAIGARITLQTDSGTQTRWIHSGSSLGAGLSLVAHFGMGDAAEGSLAVTWPDGEIEELGVVTSNQRLNVQQGVR